MDRIKLLCSYLSPCVKFADVACDHGYCAEYMLKNDLCERAVISDISAHSLSKAEKLLSAYVSSGRCRSVCCNGLEGVDADCDEVLIAGIGGEEIINILENAFVPENFVFQPMKNAGELRAFLLGRGCRLTVDDVFTDGRNYYFIIKGKREGGSGRYSRAQLEYGRDSLKNPVFYGYLKEELGKKRSYLSRAMTQSSRDNLEKTVKFMEEVLLNEDAGNT